MDSYWIKFDNRPAACVDAADKKEAKRIAEELTGNRVIACDILPYPAAPRLNYAAGACPTFCFAPEECAGRSSCPRRRACCD